jgi:glycosyltransferase involved in cell wall biosynthesis
VRILQLVDGDRWTGPAAVVFDQTAALVAAGVEAQFGFFGDSRLSERLRSIGWARPLLRRIRGPFGWAAEVRRLSETVARERFDVLHAHRSYDHTLAAAALAGTPVRLVRTLHHLRHARPDPATRLVFARTDAFAYANAAIAARFARTGPVLAPVVDTERFRPGPPPEEIRSRFALPPRGFLAGTVGKLSDGRGHAEAIEAAAKLPAIRLVHVGHGEHREALEGVARARGSADRNLWVGYQEEALPDLYRLFDAFLFTASGSDQGQRAILEAMASGVPVVALDLPGVRDLVTDGTEGFVASDPQGLASALERLLADETLRHAMGSRARERSRAFTAERFVASARPFYAAVLGERTASDAGSRR